MNEKKDRKSRRDRMESGQSLVEISLGLIILVFIVSGLIDIGRAYFVYIGLQDAASEAALYLAMNPNCQDATSGPECVEELNAEWRGRNAGYSPNASGISIQPDLIDMTFCVGSTPKDSCTKPNVDPASYNFLGGYVAVKMTYPFRPITPIISGIWSDAGAPDFSVYVEQAVLYQAGY